MSTTLIKPVPVGADKWRPDLDAKLKARHTRRVNRIFKRAVEKLLAEWDAEKRRLREYKLRRKTIRINDGSNQCLPPRAWIALADRIAN